MSPQQLRVKGVPQGGSDPLEVLGQPHLTLRADNGHNGGSRSGSSSSSSSMGGKLEWVLVLVLVRVMIEESGPGEVDLVECAEELGAEPVDTPQQVRDIRREGLH